MTHIRSRTGFSHTLLAAGLAVAMTLAGTSALWANGHGGQGGHGGHSAAGLGHFHGGHSYQHNCYSKFGCGWTKRYWRPSQNCWVYWCPSESCWYTYDAADETFTPCDNWTDENMSGLQYGP